MAVVPFMVFMGFGTLFKYTDVNLNLMISMFVLVIVLGYGISFGSFVAVQKSKCGKVHDYGSIAKYAGISTAIQTGILLLISFVGWFRNVVTSLMSPDTDVLVSESAAYGYYSFWGILFGLAFGGNMSGICP